MWWYLCTIFRLEQLDLLRSAFFWRQICRTIFILRAIIVRALYILIYLGKYRENNQNIYWYSCQEVNRVVGTRPRRYLEWVPQTHGLLGISLVSLAILARLDVFFDILRQGGPISSFSELLYGLVSTKVYSHGIIVYFRYEPATECRIPVASHVIWDTQPFETAQISIVKEVLVYREQLHRYLRQVLGLQREARMPLFRPRNQSRRVW